MVHSEKANRSALLSLMLILIIIALIMAACSDDDKPNNPQPTGLGIDSTYFPIGEGDSWYYTSSDTMQIVRAISGDTVIVATGTLVIFGDSIEVTDTGKKVLENGVTAQAWSRDSIAFYIHLIGDIYRPNPPLPIPYELELNVPFEYWTRFIWTENSTEYFQDDSGTTVYRGDVQRTVPAGLFDSVIQITYNPAGQSSYDEYYARNVGLLDDGDYILDSAFVGGIWYRP